MTDVSQWLTFPEWLAGRCTRSLKHRSFGRCTQGLLAEDERHALIDYIAANPDAGDLMVGTGGARKMRWAVRGKGKSGGVRVITFYSGPPVPVFLLTAFGKGQKIDLTKAERNELRKVLGGVAAEYQKGAKKYVQGRREHPSRRP